MPRNPTGCVLMQLQLFEVFAEILAIFSAKISAMLQSKGEFLFLFLWGPVSDFQIPIGFLLHDNSKWNFIRSS